MNRALTVRPLTCADWPAVDALFGANGACGGCWCMYWRADSTGRGFQAAKGEPNRRAFKRLVETGSATGVLAFADGAPVGWASVAPRDDFAFLRRAKSLPQAAGEPTWSVTCFFIPAAWRNRGVAGRLLDGAVALAGDGGARSLEGYATIASSAKPLPAAFAHTGIPSLFERAGFRRVTTVGARAIYSLEYQ